MFLSYYVRVSELIHALYLPEFQGTPCSKHARNLSLATATGNAHWKLQSVHVEPVTTSTTTCALEIKCVSCCGFEFNCSHLISDFAPVSSKEFPDIEATIGCGFTLKRVRDMISTYSQMNRTDKHSQNSSIIWPVWLNG